MFEFGRKYSLQFFEQNGRKSKTLVEKNMEVVSVEMPLVKFKRGGQEVVVNASSPVFVKGTLEV